MPRRSTVIIFFSILAFSAFLSFGFEQKGKPGTTPLHHPPDSMAIISGEPVQPLHNPPRSGIFNECAYCDAARSEWHTEIGSLKHMAYECGFDYLLIRFDRVYRYADATVSATYYFSALPNQFRFDSALVRFSSAKENKTLFFPCSSCIARPGIVPQVPDTSFSAKADFIDKTALFSRSFSSAMLAKNTGKGLRVAFSFGYAGMAFVLDEHSGINSYEIPRQLQGNDSSCAAYKLASFFNARPVASENSDPGSGPSITNVAISYDDLQQLVVSFTAVSTFGLREAQFGSINYKESIYFKGSKREGITKTLQLDSSHYVLSIKVYDVRGNATVAYYPVFSAKREEGRKQLAHVKRLSEERIWAEKTPANTVLYTLGQFDGNMGWLFKMLAQSLIDQDVAADSMRDVKMREALMPDTAHPKISTTDTTREIIGE
jgi:hypothetical protein